MNFNSKKNKMPVSMAEAKQTGTKKVIINGQEVEVKIYESASAMNPISVSRPLQSTAPISTNFGKLGSPLIGEKKHV